jgi:hypothetical protein
MVFHQMIQIMMRNLRPTQKDLMQMRLRLSIPHEFRARYVRQEVLVLPSAHLFVPLGLGQGEAEEGSFSSTFTLHMVNNVVINHYIFLVGCSC